MKKEIIVYFEDADAFQIDVADPNKMVEKFRQHSPKKNLRIVTFQSDLLINYIGEDVCKCDILDLECLDKQIRQSVGLAEPKEKWSVPNMLSAYLDVEEKTWEYEDRFELMKLLADCYARMKELGAGEWERIERVEIPVNKILYKAQFDGLYFQNEEIEPLCSELHRKIYGYKNRVQLELGFTGDDLESYLRLKNIEYGSLDDNEVRHLCNEHPELEPFRKIRNHKRNLNCLIALSAVSDGSNLCKPLFKGFGSSTGRIFMRDPSLQNLNRKYRSLLEQNPLPDDYRYVYVDFGQFEAGILAGLSGNEELNDLYENDGIYEKLLSMSDLKDRDLAKTAFYCFVYGGIIWKGTESFFAKYGLKNIVDTVIGQAATDGYVQTQLGNKRKMKNETDTKWIVNHYIQGNSSLIFKQALIDVHQQFGSKVALQIPMHDAALYIVHSDVSTESIIDTFKNAFTKWIPDCKPIVKEKDFFND